MRPQLNERRDWRLLQKVRDTSSRLRNRSRPSRDFHEVRAQSSIRGGEGALNKSRGCPA